MTMFEFFEKLEALAPENEERLPDKRVDKIKASVLSRIEEDKPMKKHFTIKPLLIAAAITATSAISAISAGAVTTPAVSEEKLPTAIAASQPAAADTPAAPENDPKPDTTSERAESPDDRIELAPPEILDNDEKGTVSALIVQPTGMELDYEVSRQKISDMEFIGEDDNGIRRYKTAAGEEVKVRLINADEENVTVYYYYEF